MIRVVLPFHLRTLARVDGELELEVAAAGDVQAVLEALETRYPVLRGTLRDHGTLKRRPFVRFFVCKEDLVTGTAGHPVAGSSRQWHGTFSDHRRDGRRLKG